MSAALGVGAFAQGLLQGYQVGDKMLTNEQEREFRGLQINKAKKDLEREGKIDGLRTELIGAAKDIIRDQSDENVSRYRQALVNYSTEAKPDTVNAMLKDFRNEDIEKTGRAAAGVISGLLSGNPAAIEQAAKLNGFVPNGFEIDTTRSGVNQDGSIRFSLMKTGTNEPMGEQVMTREQLIQKGLGFLSSSDKTFELMAKLSDSQKDRDVKLYGIDTEASTARDRTREIGRGNTINENYRQNALADKNLQNDLSEIRNVFAPRIDAIKTDPDAKWDEKTRSRMIADVEAKAGFVDSVVRANAERNVRVPVRQIAANVESLMRGEGIKPIEGYENSGYGLLAGRYIVPLPPTAKGLTERK